MNLPGKGCRKQSSCGWDAKAKMDLLDKDKIRNKWIKFKPICGSTAPASDPIETEGMMYKMI